MTSAVYIMIALLLAWALIRRPQWITVSMAIAFASAIAAAEMTSGDNLRSILMGFDALVVIAMWFLWHAYRSERAALVASLGFVKIWLGIASATTNITWLVWASGNNAIFVLQVLIAGGFLDGIIAWVGNSCLRTRSRRRSLLGYLEKIR